MGNYRRQHHHEHASADFFDPNNPVGLKLREEAAQKALTDMIHWMKTSHGVVGVFDATNSNQKRRKMIYDMCEAANIEILFVENICTDEKQILQNIMDVKLTSPDYQGQDPQKSAIDFRNRIRFYEEAYESIDEEYSYVKLIDIGSQTIINSIKDYMQSRIVYYLMNLHISPRSIWLSRVMVLNLV